jgi:hypothetical protein
MTKRCQATSVLGRCELTAGHAGNHINGGDGWPGPAKDTTMKKPTGIQWFAGCESITRMGPYKTQLAAWNALTLNETHRLITGRIHAVGSYVWPEEVKPKSKPKSKRSSK